MRQRSSTRRAPGSAYSSLAFNVLVNRVARLSVMRLSLSAPHKSKEDAAKDLCVFLQKELTPYHVLSSPDQVTVAFGKEGEIELSDQFRCKGFRVPGAVFIFTQFIVRPHGLYSPHSKNLLRTFI